jgi:tRNA(Arg) A34 adenosine deaminase TadA
MGSKSRQQITAVIYDKRGRVLSVGQNSYIKTHPMQATHAQKVGEPEKIYLHAEIHAITRCPDLSRAYRILVSRWDRQGRPMLAAPCAVCKSAIDAAGIQFISHT